MIGHANERAAALSQSSSNSASVSIVLQLHYSTAATTAIATRSHHETHKSVARGDPGGACKPGAVRSEDAAKKDEVMASAAGDSSSWSESSSKMRCWLLLRSNQYLAQVLSDGLTGAEAFTL
jgi:hypothetical protein